MREMVRVVGISLLLATAAAANEIRNPSFEEPPDGDTWVAEWARYEPGDDKESVKRVDSPHNGDWSVRCEMATSPEDPWGEQSTEWWLRQIVDETQLGNGEPNPGWDPDKHKKVVDVSFWAKRNEFDGCGIRVRLDWWPESFNDGPMPVGEAPNHTPWYEYGSEEIEIGNWTQLSFRHVLPEQPRYLSIEFAFRQPTGEELNWIDDVEIIGVCIPEPTTFSLMGVGILSILLARRRSRHGVQL